MKSMQERTCHRRHLKQLVMCVDFRSPQMKNTSTHVQNVICYSWMCMNWTDMKKVSIQRKDCDFSTKSEIAYRDHVSTHVRLNFECDVCGKKGKDQEDINEHIQTIHLKESINTSWSLRINQMELKRMWELSQVEIMLRGFSQEKIILIDFSLLEITTSGSSQEQIIGLLMKRGDIMDFVYFGTE